MDLRRLQNDFNILNGKNRIYANHTNSKLDFFVENDKKHLK